MIKTPFQNEKNLQKGIKQKTSYSFAYNTWRQNLSFLWFLWLKIYNNKKTFFK